MREVKFKEWIITLHSPCKGWTNIHASRDIDAGSRAVRTHSGGWCKIAALRTRYHLAWNGSRFADSTELKAIQKKHRALFDAIRQAVGGEV